MNGRIRRLLRWLVTVRYPYANPSDMRRARALLVIDLTFFVMGVSWLVLNRMQSGSVSTLVVPALSAGVAWLGAGISHILVQSGRIRPAGRAITIAYFLGVTLFTAPIGADQGAVLAVALVVILASVLLSTREVVISAALCTVSLVVIQHLHTTGVIVSASPAFDLAMVGAATLLVDAVVLWYFSADREATLREALDTARRLRATAQIGQTASATLDFETMLDQTVAQIRDEFDLYHVQVFLLDDEGKQAILKAGTGAVGQSLLDRGHRLEVGSNSVIGQVTARSEPVVARDTDPIHRRNPLLPETRTELALPLVVSRRVIGALDVQSRRPNAFSQADIEAFQVIATQLATTIENARLFAQEQQRAEESQALLQQAQASLAEVERLNRRLTRQAWDEYLEARGQNVAGVTVDNDRAQSDTVWTPTLTLAAHENRPVLSKEGEQQLIAVPVRLGGEVIGAIEIELDAATPPSDALEVAQAVAMRLALTVQNVRLVEQSQRQAQQEYQLGEIAGALQRQASVDDMLSVAVSELGRVLGAEHAAIRLGLRQTQATLLGDEPGNGNGRRGD